MDMIYGPSFQPIQAKAFADAYTRASAADRATARQAAQSRMEVTGAVPVRPVSSSTQDSFARQQFGQAATQRGHAPRKDVPQTPAQAMRDAWPLSFAGVLALYL